MVKSSPVSRGAGCLCFEAPATLCPGGQPSLCGGPAEVALLCAQCSFYVSPGLGWNYGTVGLALLPQDQGEGPGTSHVEDRGQKPV